MYYIAVSSKGFKKKKNVYSFGRTLHFVSTTILMIKIYLQKSKLTLIRR